MNELNSLKDFILFNEMDENNSDVGQKSSSRLDLKSESTYQPKSALRAFPSLKFTTEGTRKRNVEKTEDLENKAQNAKEVYKSPKFVKFNDFAKPQPPSDTQSLETLMKESCQEIKLIFEKWTVFNEIESFEKLIPTRWDKLLKEALECDENLKKQKSKLDEIARNLSKLWKKN